MKKLFALLMALTMTLQLATPAWADTVQTSDPTTETTSAAEETEAPTEETPAEESTAPAEEDAEAPTEETSAEETEAPAEETTVPTEKAEEAESPAEEPEKLRVTFLRTPEDLTLVVFPAEGDIDQAIEPEADGTYLLEPGAYAYFAAAQGYEATEGRFTVTEQDSLVEITLSAVQNENEAETLEEDVLASGTCGEKVTWVLDRDGTLTISGSGAMPDFNTSSNVAPWYKNRKDILHAVVKSGVTGVGDYAFYGCYKLTDAVFESGVKYVGSYMFQDCAKLTSVELPEGLKSIYSYAFYKCSSLTSVNIPEGVTSIGYNAFSGCSSLTSVSIPEGVTSIDFQTFYDCSSLTSVSIPEGVTSIGSSAFYGCSKLTSVSIPEGVTSIGSDVFSGCSSLTSVNIPEGVTSIGSDAFSGCSSLTSVNIPEGVTSIGSYTFSGCSSLTSVRIPEGVTSIGSYAFSGCSSLTSVNIPEGVTSIGSSAFSGCSSLTSVSIPESMTSIGSDVFSGCSSLTSVSIPEGVTSIERYAFYGCSNLTSVSIPEGVTSIGESAFSGCSGLTSVSIPKGVTSIGSYAFRGCSSLTSVSIPESVTSIGSYAFSGCSSLTSVSIPESVTSIGSYAFSGCSSLTSVRIPEGVTSIGDSAFRGCSNLASVRIPEGVTSIGQYAFYNCSRLKDVYYGGDEVAWKEIEIGNYNWNLTGAFIHYGKDHICQTHLISAVEPTCTTAGNNAYYLCDACGRVYRDAQNREETTIETETLAALGHDMTETEAKDATCTQDGNNRYYTCGNCHKVFIDAQGQQETTVEAQTLAAFGHTIRRIDTVAPTCTEKGHRTYYFCETCQTAFKDREGNEATTIAAETIPALGHTMVKTEAVAPTHTAGGNNAYYTCSTCHKVFKDEKGLEETTVEAEQLPRLPGIAHGKCGDLDWLLSDEGVLILSGQGRVPDYNGANLAPWYSCRRQIKALQVEEGVLSVGDYAFFDCSALESIRLPQSLTRLGRNCFADCDSLNLLDISGLPQELTQKVTDLTGIPKLPEMLASRVNAAYSWSLENAKDAPARLSGSELTVLRSGTFRLVCTEEYTGLTASVEVSARTTTVIRPEDTEQLVSGESLTLSAWAMPFEMELQAKWSLSEESKAYADITQDGVLTAGVVAKPVQITVLAAPTAGEDSAEKTLWILPKTTAMGILADGHLAGDSLTVELTERTELTLTARIQPQGAMAEVLWSSSREDVAQIDETGTVRFLKPGTTVIRAESRDGSGIAAELTLKGKFVDAAEALTLTADAEAYGLEVGRTAQLTLSGENAIDPANVAFYITQGTAATVDEQGVLTAGQVPGTVTVAAVLKNDPLLRRAELTLQVIPALVRSLRLNAEVSQEWGYIEEADGTSSLYAELNAVAGKNRTFRITALGCDDRNQWSAVENLSFETSDSSVAQVDDRGQVTLTAKGEGACVITVRCGDVLHTQAQLTISVRDRSPRLESAKLTLNSNLTAGVSTGLVDSYGNRVQFIAVYDYDKATKAYETEPSRMFAAEVEDGTLTLRSLGAQKNGTYNVKLAVSCLSGIYEFPVQIKVANSLPALTVKQLSKFNLFYADSTAELTVTAKDAQVETVELVGTTSFRLDENGVISYADSYQPGDKVVTKGTLRVTLAGFQVPVEKAVTIATVTTAPKLTMNPASSAINLALAEPECQVSVLENGKTLDLTGAEIAVTGDFISVENRSSALTFRLTGTKGGTVSLTLRLPGWTQSVKLSHRITVESKLPTVKLDSTTLKLNSVFTQQTSATAVSLTQGNMDLGTMTFTPAAKEGTAARVEAEKIALRFDPDTHTVKASLADPEDVPKNGTYSYSFTAALADGTALSGGTIKVNVVNTTPKAKLSAASVKLNRYLAGSEQATVAASLTGGAGYRLTGFEGMPDYMGFDAETGSLTLSLPDEDFTGETCTLLPVIADETTGQEITLNTKLTFKVQTINTDKLTLSLTAKGKLDTANPESVLTYTVNKVNNCLNTVDNVFLEGQDADAFQAELDTTGAKPVVTLRTVPGQTYATNRSYKLQFRFTVCGREVLSNVLTVKVTQTALKVTVPKTTTFYLSQTAALRCGLASNVPMESVTLNAKTTPEFLKALGGEQNMSFDGTCLEFHMANPGALTAGKSYTIQMDITPENCAENVKPTLVKLTVKVMK